MAIAGGAMLGYCAIGRVRIASPPPSMMTMARTHANIGRSMKKSDTRLLLRLLRRTGSRRFELVGRHFMRVYHAAGAHRLDADDDDLIARRHARAHQPLIAYGTVGFDDVHRCLVIITNHRYGCLAEAVVPDGALRDEQTLLVDTFFQALAHEHAGQQDTLRIGKHRPQRDRTRAWVYCDFGKLQLAGKRIRRAIL